MSLLICVGLYAVGVAIARLVVWLILKRGVPPEATPKEIAELQDHWRRGFWFQALIKNVVGFVVLLLAVAAFPNAWTATLIIGWFCLSLFILVEPTWSEASRIRYCADTWRRDDNRKAAEEAAERRQVVVTKAASDRVATQQALQRCETEVLTRFSEYRMAVDFRGNKPLPQLVEGFRQVLLQKPPQHVGLLRYTSHPMLRQIYGAGSGFPPPPTISSD